LLSLKRRLHAGGRCDLPFALHAVGTRAHRAVSPETRSSSQMETRMKRFHVHVAVSDLEPSIGFYSTLFGGAPSVRKADYAKWMLDDPRVNFAISLRGGTAGVNHLGLQVDTADELEGMREQLLAADRGLVEEKDANCCYARVRTSIGSPIRPALHGRLFTVSARFRCTAKMPPRRITTHRRLAARRPTRGNPKQKGSRRVVPEREPAPAGNTRHRASRLARKEPAPSLGALTA